jgi:regulator of nucleoside diphosphate kinase
VTGTVLTEKDFAILEAILMRRQALGDPLAPLIECKLAEAIIVASDAIEPCIATLNSRIAFCIDALPAEERTLVRHEGRGPVGRGLPIDTRRGLAILGMTVGQTAQVTRRDGGQELLRLEKILFQPEAVRRAEAGAVVARRCHRPSLVLVHDAGSDWQPLGWPEKIRQEWSGDDDPGPTAA